MCERGYSSGIVETIRRPSGVDKPGGNGRPWDGGNASSSAEWRSSHPALDVCTDFHQEIKF